MDNSVQALVMFLAYNISIDWREDFYVYVIER